ncbi:glycosyltransferase family 2 protein [Dokdonia sp. 4H-3-7-5]|uniref:glycosyltransferase family 2 protein n=1 Tax=Dokdonia sp. (strain 4H-3-7-5) TaxID=983548 RepID=UPI00020A6622|nr:glycosyltransferase family 2 protein [Dokdonia sp. 4H-3-7-5]AEE18391.1 glycosyl transferase family 2 [Dokdonia sp. 4H-3-7-5]
MQLSIIIVSYNVMHYLELCLDSVQDAIAFTDAEIIVVDNASVDGSVQMVKDKFPTVKIVANKKNAGFSSANNQGVALAKGTYICILNPDTVVPSSVFESLLKITTQEQYTGAQGVRLVNGRGAYLPESKRNVPTLRVALSKMMGYGSSYYATHIVSDARGEVAILVGAFMFMSRNLYEEVGGFDERYFMFGEDIDLSYTITKAGYSNHYIGDETILHFKGESTVRDEHYRKCFYGAMQLFYEKHFNDNVFKGFLVNIGVSLAKFKAGFHKRYLQSNLDGSKYNIQEYLLLTDNKFLSDAFAKAVTKPVTVIGDMCVPKEGQELVFDAAYVAYSDIIKEIITYRGSGATYKIIPKNGTFAIGSNSSLGKGDVIEFNRD